MHKRYNLFIHYVNNYVLSAFYISGTSLGTRDLAVSHIDRTPYSHGIYILFVYLYYINLCARYIHM